MVPKLHIIFEISKQITTKYIMAAKNRLSYLAVSPIITKFAPLNLILKLEKQHYAKTFTRTKRNGHLSCDIDANGAI